MFLKNLRKCQIDWRNNIKLFNLQDLSPLEVDKADLGPQEDHQAASSEV